MREEKKAGWRKLFIRSALTCIEEKGIEEVQMVDVAQCAGVSVRTLNRYFPNRQEFLLEVASVYLEEMNETFINSYECVDKKGMNGMQRLLLLFSMERNFYRTDSIAALKFTDLTYYWAKNVKNPRTYSAGSGVNIRSFVMKIIQAGQADGSIRTDLDLSLAVPMIASSYNGLMQRILHAYLSDMKPAEKDRLPLYLDEYLVMLKDYLKPKA